MSEQIFFGYLGLTFASLITAAQLYERRTGSVRVSALIGAVLGAALLMVPIFYLLYAGVAVPGGNRVINLGLATLLPFLWAHLALYAFATGQTSMERYAPGAGLFLTVPALFLIVWTGMLLRFRHALWLADWAILLGSLALWLRARRRRAGAGAGGGGPDGQSRPDGRQDRSDKGDLVE